MANNMVLSYVPTYLHFRILEFPLIYHHLPVKGVNLKMSYINSINQPYISDVYWECNTWYIYIYYMMLYWLSFLFRIPSFFINQWECRTSMSTQNAICFWGNCGTVRNLMVSEVLIKSHQSHVGSGYEVCIIRLVYGKNLTGNPHI